MTPILAVPFGNSSELLAESASLISTASESSSTERSALAANIEITRDSTGATSSPAGRLIRVSSTGSGTSARGGSTPFGERGTRIRTWVPRPGPPLISKLSVSAAISGRPRRRLRCSTSASGRMPSPKSRTLTTRQSSSGHAATSSGPSPSSPR